MYHSSFNLPVLLSILIVFSSCNKNSDTEEEKSITVITATGDITTEMNRFRTVAGEQLNTTPGHSSGRREINWDAVPDNLLDQPLAPDFFNPTGESAPVARQRGLAYASASGEFRVSNNGFAVINPGSAGQFNAFSGNKTFASVSSNLWEVEFQVPGQITPATVKGFGVVFSDVDTDSSTSLEFFDGPISLGKYYILAHDATSSFSFLGVYFNNKERISRISVSHQGNISGTEKDITNGGKADLVVMDDFIYSEPLQR